MSILLHFQNFLFLMWVTSCKQNFCLCRSKVKVFWLTNGEDNQNLAKQLSCTAVLPCQEPFPLSHQEEEKSFTLSSKKGSQAWVLCLLFAQYNNPSYSTLPQKQHIIPFSITTQCCYWWWPYYTKVYFLAWLELF